MTCWYRWGGVNLASPLPHSHKAGWEKWGIADFGPDSWEQMFLERSVRGETYLGKGSLMRARGARPTCVVHHTRLALLGECPSCKKT